MVILNVGFSKAKSRTKILSTLIRLIDGTPFSHVFIRWNSDYLDRDIIYQASGSAVNFMEGKHFDSINQTVGIFKIELSEETHKKVVQFAMDRAGTPYSIKQLAGLTLAKIKSLFGLKASNPFKDGRSHYICCELVAEILIDLGYPISQNLDDITPKDIYNLLNHGKN